ncbi:MAG: cobalt transporter [Proteobacteria bacterium]|nr:cobalt transporter [Pseudomonadota bacterium]
MIETALQSFDPRIKILSGVILGLLVWQAGFAGLVIYLFLLGALSWQLRATLPGQRHVLKSYGWFLLLWTGAKLGMDIWSGASLPVASLAASLLAARLSCLLAVGLVLALSTSSRQLGMALTWFLRPVLRSHAWKGALALALMVHFLPITWLTLAQMRETTSRRCSHLGLFRRMLIMGQAVMRNLGQKTWNQTLGVACRRLDRPEAWQPKFRTGIGQWGCFVMLMGAGVALALL